MERIKGRNVFVLEKVLSDVSRRPQPWENLPTTRPYPGGKNTQRNQRMYAAALTLLSVIGD